MPSDKIKKLNEFIKKNNIKNYPIDNKLLEEETDYIKNNYFKMLALILQQEDEVADTQYNLLKRMLSGVQTDYELEDYLRQALDIEIQEYVEFTEQMKEHKAKYRFILDALLLSCCAENNEEQLRLVTAFVEAFKVQKEELQYIAEVCKSILEQDSKAYWRTENSGNAVLLTEHIQTYLKDYVEDVFEVTDESIDIYFVEKKDVDIRELVNANGYMSQNTVIIKNAVFNLAEIGMNFSECQRVEFYNCEFINGKNSLSLDEVGFAGFYDCSFRNFSYHVMGQKAVGEVEITRCLFENCYCKYSRGTSDWKQLGGVIFTSNKDENALNVISETKFINCGGINSSGYYSSAIISNALSVVNNCEFDNCWHYHGTSVVAANKIDPNDERRILFLPGTTTNNCTVNNSANLS